jgi:hypothetical protein
MEIDEINLDTFDKSFEYERQSRIIENLNIDELKKISRMYLKLYLKQQEVLSSINPIKV